MKYYTFFKEVLFRSLTKDFNGDNFHNQGIVPRGVHFHSHAHFDKPDLQHASQVPYYVVQLCDLISNRTPWLKRYKSLFSSWYYFENAFGLQKYIAKE